MKKTPLTLLREIQEQPALLREILGRYPDVWRSREVPISLPETRCWKLVGIAEGSSKHCIDIAAPFLEEWTGLPVWSLDPEGVEEKIVISRQYQGLVGSIFDSSYFLAVSQSGQTASVLRILEMLQEEIRHPLPILTLTNRENATLTNLYGNGLCIGAGEEKSIAATKTMTASLLLLLQWGLYVGYTKMRMPQPDHDRILESLAVLPARIETLFEPPRMEALYQFTRRLMEVNHFILLSKGPLVLILDEAGLKLTETSSNIVYCDNSESFKHGPKVILSGIQGEQPNCIYVVPTDEALAERLFKDIGSHFWVEDELAFQDERVFFITFENSPPVPQHIRDGLSVTDDKILTLPAATSLESLFLAIITFQLISYHLAILKGEDPNNPALEKAVTE